MPLLLEGTPTVFPTIAHVRVDQRYTGTGKTWITAHLGWTVTVVQHPSVIRHKWMSIGDLNHLATLRFAWTKIPREQAGFRGVLPRRWVVERTFAWLGQNRRLSKDYERLCETSEALMYAVMSRFLMRRLARS